MNCAPNGKCHILPSGPTCVCPKGFRLKENKQECEVNNRQSKLNGHTFTVLILFQDINECLNFGICSQGCVNTIGSYNCTCAPKFKLQKNNRTCKTKGKSEALLLYAASKSVSWFSLKSKHLKRVAENLNQVIGITYDGEYVYWTDISIQVESIMKAKVDGSEVEVCSYKRWT